MGGLNVDLIAVVRRNNKSEMFVSSGGVNQSEDLEELQRLIEESEDFAGHEAVFIGRAPKFRTLFFAFVHNTTRGLAQGGLRFMDYDSMASVISDGLRLSQGMSRKNAIADLWWGGGKGIIPITDELVAETFGGDATLADRADRDPLFEAYGKFVASLNGIYYTAADINTNDKDMRAILRTNRFVTCLPRKLGGSGDPSPHTAEGVFLAIRTVQYQLTGTADLSGLTVAVQGAGKVGGPLVEKLVKAGAKVYVSDNKFETDPEFLESFRSRFPSVEIIPGGPGRENDIFAVEADIIAPCAVGGVINAETIELFGPTVKVVCGGANNILGDENRDGETLYEKEIVYIPDFISNWMGIVNCANEAFGYLEEDIEKALEKVTPTVREVLDTARAENISHTAASHQLADAKLTAIPPDELRQRRGQRLIDNLLEQMEPVVTENTEADVRQEGVLVGA